MREHSVVAVCEAKDEAGYGGVVLPLSEYEPEIREAECCVVCGYCEHCPADGGPCVVCGGGPVEIGSEPCSMEEYTILRIRGSI